MNRERELNYLKGFVRAGCFDTEIERDQLRCLWTAYCLHYNLDVDTAQYDADALELWEVMREAEEGTADWSDFDSFDNYLCRYLV